jgi:hypothetical protein
VVNRGVYSVENIHMVQRKERGRNTGYDMSKTSIHIKIRSKKTYRLNELGFAEALNGLKFRSSRSKGFCRSFQPL